MVHKLLVYFGNKTEQFRYKILKNWDIVEFLNFLKLKFILEKNKYDSIVVEHD